MRIALFTCEIGRGGASAAALRLVSGLRRRGHTVDIFCMRDDVGDAGAVVVSRLANDSYEDGMTAAMEAFFQHDYIGSCRTARSNTRFSAAVAGYAIEQIPDLDQYDAFSVHWIALFLSVASIERLVATDKPVILTLHDMFQLTGGCHYAAGCRGFERTCSPCPQLSADPLNLPNLTLTRRRSLAGHPNLAAIAPSAWLAQEAKASRVFVPDRVFHIDNAVDTQLFAPMSMVAARTVLGLPQDAFVIAMGAQDNGEHRKGYYNVIDLLSALLSLPDVATDRIVLLVFGHNGSYVENRGFRVKSLGLVCEDATLVTAYSAADLLLLLSLEDNQPNVMLEAMACGTPVAGFAIGGLRETIVDGENGILSPPFDTGLMAQAIAALLEQPQALAAMRIAARDLAEARFPLDRQASRYETRFKALACADTASAGAGSAVSMDTPPRTKHMQLPLETDPSLSGKIRGYVVQHQLLRAQAARIEALDAELAAARSQLDSAYRLLGTIDWQIDQALGRLLASRSWRLTCGIRRRLGIGRWVNVPGSGTPEQLPVKVDLLLSMMRSVWWDIAMPLRMIRRPLDRLRRIIRVP